MVGEGVDCGWTSGGGSVGGAVGAGGLVSTVAWQDSGAGRGEEFLSVGFVVVLLTLVGPFIITLRCFARPLVTPVGKRGGGEIDFCEMVSARSTVRLLRV